MNTKRRAHCQLWHDWKERIIRIGDEQTSLQNQFDNLRNEYSDTHPRIEALEADVNALDGRLIIAESDIAEAENRISTCESDIDRLESEVDALDGRVTITESDIADAEDRISGCESDIDRIDAELVNKTGDINALANRMTLAEADIDDIDTRLEGIETGEILLSQLNVDADKDWQGRTISNLNLENVTVKGSKIEPTRINNSILLWDGQEDIENERVYTRYGSYTYHINDDPTMPYAKYLQCVGALTPYHHGLGDYRTPFIPVTPGETLYMEMWVRDGGGGLVGSTHFYRCYWNAEKTTYDRGTIRANGSAPASWQKFSATFTIPNDGSVRYIQPLYLINDSKPDPEYITHVAGPRLYRIPNWDFDMSAKIISADGVVIKDGGTVDGVDISTHTHDGTAVGGPKINLANVEVTADKSMGMNSLRDVRSLTIGNYTQDSGNDLNIFSSASGGAYIRMRSGRNDEGANIYLDGANGELKIRGISTGGGSDLLVINKTTKISTFSGPIVCTTINGATINATKTAEWDGKQEKLATFASSNYKYYHDDEVQVSSTTMTKVKTFTFSKAGVTTARVYFEFFGTPGRTGYAEVRKNGIVLATSEHSEGYEYLPMTHDLDLNISAGDTVELWLRSGYEGAVFRVRNFRIGYDIGMGGSVTIS